MSSGKSATTLSDTGQILVTQAATDAWIDARGLPESDVEQARRELTALLMRARRTGETRTGAEQWAGAVPPARRRRHGPRLPRGWARGRGARQRAALLAEPAGWRLLDDGLPGRALCMEWRYS